MTKDQWKRKQTADEAKERQHANKHQQDSHVLQGQELGRNMFVSFQVNNKFNSSTCTTNEN